MEAPTLNHHPQPRHKDAWFLTLIVGLIIALVCVLFNKCEQKPTDIDFDVKKDSLVNDIRKKFDQKDSVKKETAKKDSVRIVYLTKWKESKPKYIQMVDSLKLEQLDSIKKKVRIIVNTIRDEADQVIKADSSVIASLKHELKIDSGLFVSYKSLAKNDSIIIFKLKKEVKKQKRITKIIAAASAVVLGGIILTR